MRRKLSVSWNRRKRLSASELHSRRRPGTKKDYSVRRPNGKESENAQLLLKTLRRLHQSN